MGQNEDFEAAREKALKLGATKVRAVKILLVLNIIASYTSTLSYFHKPKTIWYLMSPANFHQRNLIGYLVLALRSPTHRFSGPTFGMFTSIFY